MKKILFFSHDPGAANCIIPIYKKLKLKPRYQVELFGKNFALKKYETERLSYQDIQKIIPVINEKTIKKFLIQNNYQIIVTGTSASDFTDRIIWAVAKQLSVPTIAILDQWLNYLPRFTFNLPGDPAIKQPTILPDKICIMDPYAKQEMVKKGFPSNILVITGQPYFETISTIQKLITPQEKNKLRQQLGIKKKDYLITFASEPIIETYKDHQQLGYTEVTIVDEIIKILNNIAKQNPQKNLLLLIKLHPRNLENIFDKTIKKITIPDNLRIKLLKEVQPHLLITVSDLILGMSSMFLIEAAIIKKPIISIQIGLKGEDPFILSRRNITQTIVSTEKLLETLTQYIINAKKESHQRFPVIKKSSNNIIKLINSLNPARI